MQWHMAALRNASRVSYRSLGPDTGFDAIQDLPVADPLAALLDACQQNGHLPRTLLYSLNAGDNMTLATIAATFVKDGERCWVSPGPAWWFHDQKDGMLAHLRQYGQVGVLANYIGMTTDSRSLLSYTRHEYFRRILCNLLGEWVETGEYPNDRASLDNLVRRICWQNAADLFHDHG
jgi:glucuronate isomerase